MNSDHTCLKTEDYSSYSYSLTFALCCLTTVLGFSHLAHKYVDLPFDSIKQYLQKSFLAYKIARLWNSVVFAIRQRFQGVFYLFQGPNILQECYIQAQGSCYRVATPSNHHFMITSEHHIQEVLDAPNHQLSLHAVAKEFLQPRYTMHGFEWKDQRGVEGTGFVRALRSLLTAHLPVLLPELRSNIATSLEWEISQSQYHEGASFVRIFPAVKRVITTANCLIFFGPDLSRNSEFRAAALEFPEAIIFAAELLRISPKFMKPFVASVATGRHKAAKLLMQHLRPIVGERLEARDRLDPSVKPADCMQWLIETSPRKPRWSVERMTGEILALWFSSVHQLAMTTTFALHDVCQYPEWAHELRLELDEASQKAMPVHPESLVLLDGFVQESVRVNTYDAISVRRKAMTPFVLPDGVRIAPGDWVCVPQKAMMQDAQFYPDPESFDPTRFSRSPQLKSSSKDGNASPRFTDVNRKWPVWGLGRTACPGRFYASLALKLILIHVLENYDCNFLDDQASRSWSWRSSIVPRASVVIRLRKRGY